MALKRDTILKKRPLPTVKVPCPEWADDGTPEDEAYVFVRTMTGVQRDAWERSVSPDGKKVKLDNIRAKLAVAVCVDDDGNQLFTEDDIAALGDVSCVPLVRIFDEASKLNGLGKEQVDELVGES